MKVFIGIWHPAHVHFFKNIYWYLNKKKIPVLIGAREKEMTLQLLHSLRIPYFLIGKHKSNMLNKMINYFQIESSLIEKLHVYQPSLIMGILDAYSSHVGRLINSKVIVFTDTEHAMINNILTFPFADYIVTPLKYKKKLNNKKHITYNGYHELAYLHPNWYKPDENIYNLLKIDPNEKFAIIRFVSWSASHDQGYTGLSIKNKIRIVKHIEKKAIPFIISEQKLPDELKQYRFTAPVHKIHDALFFSNLYIGEGGTMATESAILGTPNILTNSLALKCGTHIELRDKYKLQNIILNIDRIKNTIHKYLTRQEIQTRWKKRRYILLKEKIDVTTFILQNIISTIFKA